MDQITSLMLDQLHESPTNPRLSFDQAALTELAYSIAQQGIMQPIVVRPITTGKPHQFEVVFGHRRLRAAALADLVTVPCIVRPMTDEEAAVAQIHENIKRADVHPVEEALGYVRLMNDHQVNVAQLCEKTGKSRAYIYARLKLSQLGKAAQEACLQGQIGPEIGLLVARYCRSAKLQKRAIELVTTEEQEGDETVRRPIPYRQAKQTLRDQFCIRLHAAPFDITDATLRPYTSACTTCSKMAGNDPELADSTDADVCTDRECYDAKLACHTRREVDRVMDAGLPLMDAATAKDVLTSKYNHHAVGYVSVTDSAFIKLPDPDDDSQDDDEGSNADISFAQALQRMGDGAPTPITAVHPHQPGVVLRLITEDEAARVLVHGHPGATMNGKWDYRLRDEMRAAQAALAPAGTSAPAAGEAPRRQDNTSVRYVPQWERELEAMPPAEQAVRRPDQWRNVMRAVMQRVRSTPRTTEDLRMLVLRELQLAGEWSGTVVDLMGWRAELPADMDPDLDWCQTKLAELAADDLAALLVLTAIENDGGNKDDRLATAQRYGVDVLAAEGKAPAADDAEDGEPGAERCPNTSDMFEAAGA